MSDQRDLFLRGFLYFIHIYCRIIAQLQNWECQRLHFLFYICTGLASQDQIKETQPLKSQGLRILEVRCWSSQWVLSVYFCSFNCERHANSLNKRQKYVKLKSAVFFTLCSTHPGPLSKATSLSLVCTSLNNFSVYIFSDM